MKFFYQTTSNFFSAAQLSLALPLVLMLNKQ
jgi:hypothetical protein